MQEQLPERACFGFIIHGGHMSGQISRSGSHQFRTDCDTPALPGGRSHLFLTDCDTPAIPGGRK